jgi:hypothetical protein
MATTQPDATEARAKALVDAFGSPDGVLRAPIGLRDPTAAAAA